MPKTTFKEIAETENLKQINPLIKKLKWSDVFNKDTLYSLCLHRTKLPVVENDYMPKGQIGAHSYYTSDKTDPKQADILFNDMRRMLNKKWSENRQKGRIPKSEDTSYLRDCYWWDVNIMINKGVFNGSYLKVYLYLCQDSIGVWLDAHVYDFSRLYYKGFFTSETDKLPVIKNKNGFEIITKTGIYAIKRDDGYEDHVYTSTAILSNEDTSHLENDIVRLCGSLASLRKDSVEVQHSPVLKYKDIIFQLSSKADNETREIITSCDMFTPKGNSIEADSNRLIAALAPLHLQFKLPKDYNSGKSYETKLREDPIFAGNEVVKRYIAANGANEASEIIKKLVTDKGNRFSEKLAYDFLIARDYKFTLDADYKGIVTPLPANQVQSMITHLTRGDGGELYMGDNGEFRFFGNKIKGKAVVLELDVNQGKYRIYFSDKKPASLEETIKLLKPEHKIALEKNFKTVKEDGKRYAYPHWYYAFEKLFAYKDFKTLYQEVGNDIEFISQGYEQISISLPLLKQKSSNISTILRQVLPKYEKLLGSNLLIYQDRVAIWEGISTTPPLCIAIGMTENKDKPVEERLKIQIIQRTTLGVGSPASSTVKEDTKERVFKEKIKNPEIVKTIKDNDFTSMFKEMAKKDDTFTSLINSMSKVISADSEVLEFTFQFDNLTSESFDSAGFLRVLTLPRNLNFLSSNLGSFRSNGSIDLKDYPFDGNRVILRPAVPPANSYLTFFKSPDTSLDINRKEAKLNPSLQALIDEDDFWESEIAKIKEKDKALYKVFTAPEFKHWTWIHYNGYTVTGNKLLGLKANSDKKDFEKTRALFNLLFSSDCITDETPSRVFYVRPDCRINLALGHHGDELTQFQIQEY
jgi:hypothetical protein